MQKGRQSPRIRIVSGLVATVFAGILIIQGCTASSQAIGGGQQEAAGGINIGDVAPDFTLADLEGNQVSLSDFRGKTVLVNFWATWCPPCLAEMPEIEAVYQEYKDRGVEVVGIDVREPREDVLQFVRKGGYSWVFVLDTAGKVTASYEIAALPTSLFIDTEGVIKAVNIGAMTKRQMEANLSEVMR
ncbi:MAG: redoxin family protein [Dehalococcoidales bacterium]|nr:redoxin family protein [Dehalococcoidales bacterium]MDP6632117.1 redoxin family protein [Dehalococcoidales bacterium]